MRKRAVAIFILLQPLFEGKSTMVGAFGADTEGLFHALDLLARVLEGAYGAVGGWDNIQ